MKEQRQASQLAEKTVALQERQSEELATKLSTGQDANKVLEQLIMTVEARIIDLQTTAEQQTSMEMAAETEIKDELKEAEDKMMQKRAEAKETSAKIKAAKKLVKTQMTAVKRLARQLSTVAQVARVDAQLEQEAQEAESQRQQLAQQLAVVQASGTEFAAKIAELELLRQNFATHQADLECEHEQKQKLDEEAHNLRHDLQAACTEGGGSQPTLLHHNVTAKRAAVAQLERRAKDLAVKLDRHAHDADENLRKCLLEFKVRVQGYRLCTLHLTSHMKILSIEGARRHHAGQKP